MTLESLNSKQQEAASIINGPVMVFAGAGSGKTRTLTYRIANMIEKGVNPNNILAITFTNKATNEMRNRLYGLVGSASASLTISTFHSLCASILRRDITAIGYKRDFQIIDDEDQLKVIVEVLDSGNYNKKEFTAKSIRKKLNFHKCFATKSDINIENKIFDEYEKLMKEYNLLDFEDLLIKVDELFSNNQHILDKYRKKFEYILVDEFQDTDMYQYKIIKMLAAEHRNLFVVGDDDQSIYGFRGANYANIKHFKFDFPDHKIVILNQNYRSTQKILEGANNLIENNVDREGKTLFSDIEGKPDDVIINQAFDQKDEVDYVISKINDLVKAGYEYKNIAVLYRSSAVARNFELGFIQSDIRYKIYGGISYLRRKEIKDMIAYLRLITFDDDVVSFKRVVNEPTRGIGLKTVSTVIDYAKTNKITIMEAIDSSEEYIKSKSKVLKDFKAMIDSFSKKLDETDLVDLFNELLDATKYIESLDDDDKQDRIDNIMEFKSILYNIENNGEIASRKEKLIAAFDEAILSDDKLSKKQDNDGVTLSTIHSVKGLEFDAVFLVALENGIFPNIIRLNDENSLEEERRIAYVAVTRAKKKLFLTCAAKRLLYGQYLKQAQSQFLLEYIKNKYVFKEKKEVESKPSDFVKPEKKNNDYAIGEMVIHSTYGEGIVVSLGDHNIGKICFTKQGLIKSFDMTHHSISKKSK
ncbi:MAG: UvrD-helicase domain-containing protein [Bacilli bacterium]